MFFVQQDPQHCETKFTWDFIERSLGIFIFCMSQKYVHKQRRSLVCVKSKIIKRSLLPNANVNADKCVNMLNIVSMFEE